MKNLEQIRAASALGFHAAARGNVRGRDKGNVLDKLPALVMGNGLLAAGAFAYAQKPDSGWRNCFDHLTRHLAHVDVGILPAGTANLHQLMEHLSVKADSRVLQLATDEALAWLGYARRFELPAEGGALP